MNQDALPALSLPDHIPLDNFLESPHIPSVQVPCPSKLPPPLIFLAIATRFLRSEPSRNPPRQQTQEHSAVNTHDLTLETPKKKRASETFGE